MNTKTRFSQVDAEDAIWCNLLEDQIDEATGSLMAIQLPGFEIPKCSYEGSWPSFFVFYIEEGIVVQGFGEACLGTLIP